MTLYFAYGSNMHGPQMKARCPRSSLVGWGLLPGHQLIFTGHSQTWQGAVASVKKQARAKVFGLVYQLGEGDLAALDRYEGYPTHYGRKTASVETAEGRVRALYYVKTGRCPPGVPSPEYLSIITRTYRAYGVPYHVV